jgi:hypothetical protein
MKKIDLNKKEVRKLLNSIRNAEDKKAVKLYLQELMDANSGKTTRDGNIKRKKANQLLDAIVRGGLKIGETVLIEELIRHLFD